MQALARRMSPPRRGWYSPLSGQSGCGGTCALKWSTAPFLPAGTQGGEALQVAVPASASAPWAGRCLCDRGPGSGSLFPPQAAAAFAAVLVPDDAQTAAAFRITAIKNSPTLSVRLPPRQALLTAVFPRGLSRGLTNSPQDCWFRRCGAVALFESSERANQKQAPTAGYAVGIPRQILLAAAFPGDSPAG